MQWNEFMIYPYSSYSYFITEFISIPLQKHTVFVSLLFFYFTNMIASNGRSNVQKSDSFQLGVFVSMDSNSNVLKSFTFRESITSQQPSQEFAVCINRIVRSSTRIAMPLGPHYLSHWHHHRQEGLSALKSLWDISPMVISHIHLLPSQNIDKWARWVICNPCRVPSKLARRVCKGCV